MFYRRQLTTFNYGLFIGRTGTGVMSLWDETVGQRGVDEVVSVLHKYIINQFQQLQNNQQRELIFWSDRCRGQTNNFQLLCAMKYWIAEKYFTTIQQKFLPTGHSFMACDRMFGLIEQHKSKSSVMVPSQWETVIKDACPLKPFQIQNMTQQNIFDFKQLENHIPRPTSLKVTENCWYKMSAIQPHIILARQNFLQGGFWTSYDIRMPNHRGRIIRRPFWTPNALQNFFIHQKYNNLLPISAEKYADLQSMLPMIMPEHHNYFINLPH